jgi:hypothetical protein
VTALVPFAQRTSAGRHRRDAVGSEYLLVNPPSYYRSTSHRLSRRQVLQVRVNDLFETRELQP